MKLEREERQELHQALKQIFTRADEIELFTQLDLDEPIGDITDAAPIPVMLLRIIQHFEARGSVDALIDAALRRVGRNGDAAATMQTVLGSVRARQQTSSTLRRLPTVEEMYARLVQLEQLVASGGASTASGSSTAGPLLSIGREAATAVEKLRASGDATQLTKEERESVQGAILLTSRPALLMHDGHFETPPDGWRSLELQRSRIEEVLANVGRVEVEGHPFLQWTGTAFLAGESVALTTIHVARELTATGEADEAPSPQPLASGRRAWINVNEAPGENLGRIGIESVVPVPDTNLAILRLDGRAASPEIARRAPMVAADPVLTDGRKVYLGGYPAYDSRRDPEVMARVFGRVFDVKRLQPGTIVRVDGAVVRHDCSTLGGNGGSPLVDLETHLVVGVHYGAMSFGAGEATRLTAGKTAAFLEQNGVRFA
jgi:hypothetical protein